MLLFHFPPKAPLTQIRLCLFVCDSLYFSIKILLRLFSFQFYFCFADFTSNVIPSANFHIQRYSFCKFSHPTLFFCKISHPKLLLLDIFTSNVTPSLNFHIQSYSCKFSALLLLPILAAKIILHSQPCIVFNLNLF